MNTFCCTDPFTINGIDCNIVPKRRFIQILLLLKPANVVEMKYIKNMTTISEIKYIFIIRLFPVEKL